MLLPNKLFSFNESSLAFFAPILTLLNSGARTPSEIGESLDISVDNLSHALGGLYALRAINLNDDGMVYICL